MELSAIFLAGVAFPEFEDAEYWRDFALGEILENMRTDLLPDGVVNVISGTDYAVTDPLLESPIPAMFTMIGSTSAGVNAMKASCTTFQLARMTLETCADL